MKTSKYDPYYGQYNPNRKDYINTILDEQDKIFRDSDKESEKKTLPNRQIILGAGILIILGVLVIYKYK